MAKTRELKRRIKSINSTKKITRTMEMVATSKMKRAQDRVVAARPYAQALGAAIADLFGPELAERFPLLRKPLPPGKGGPKTAAVLLITSNRGLAGAFNANLIRLALKRTRELEEQGHTVELYGVGKKGIKFLQHSRRTLKLARLDIGDRPTAAHAMELAAPLITAYEAGELASVDIVYANFKSALSTPPAILRVLPVETTGPAAGGKEKGKSPSAGNYILLPGAEAILSQLLPLYVKNQFYRALVETAASEQGARRTAMKNATDNATEILGKLTITYNRARQAQITQELAEIVGGAAALAG